MVNFVQFFKAVSHDLSHIPYGLLRLENMINYQVFGLCQLLRGLYVEEFDLRLRFQSDDAVPEELRIGMVDMLKSAFLEIQWLGLDAARDRLHHFNKSLEDTILVHEYLREVHTLRQAIEDGLRHRCFYHYPKEKAEPLLSFEKDWEKVITAFPSNKEDALAALDCWALEKNTACVFHLMRVAEYGLRALAKERRVKIKRKPLEWAEWQEVIAAIRKKVDMLADDKRMRRPERGEVLEFYKGALGEFEAFKDAYRNNVMHARKTYDEAQAKSVLLHVRGFMERLACRIDENMTSSIKWKS